MSHRGKAAALGASLLCLACAGGAVPVLAQTSANVTVNVSSGLANVPAEGYGVDSSVYDGYMLSSGLGASLKSGGFNAIRYPGGSYADIFNFISGSNQTLNDGGYFAPGDTFNNFMSTLVAPSGAKPVITVNYGSRTDGQVGVLLINDDPSNSTTVAVGISGATLATTGTQYTFGNANFASGSSTPSSGISSKSISGVGSNFNITVPAYTTVAVLIPQSSTNSSNLIANGTYVIANNHSELAIDDYGWSTQQGTNMVQWSATGGTNQKWTLTNLGNNYVELVNGTSGYALDVSGASQASGAAVIQWPYHSGANQIWKVVSKGNGSYELLNQNSGLALSVPGLSTSNGTQLDQETVTGADNQLWSFAN
jgi:hypothetical protein